MDMEINTHRLADKTLLGIPVEIVTGKNAVVKLVATENMKVDEKGLIHGGFTFGLADYAAMLSINHPNVVIGSANVRFTAPVRCGEVMVATARVRERSRNKYIVEVEVRVNERLVFTGELVCFVLEKHVLD